MTTVAEATKWADVVMVLVPDQTAAKLYAEEIGPNLTAGKPLMFAHGFNIHFRRSCRPRASTCAWSRPRRPAIGCVKSSRGRRRSRPHRGPSGCDRQGSRARLSYLKGIGCTRAGVLETTFAEETETDLFGEQAVLCGGVTALVKAGFETLVEAGYQPESAYFECCTN